MKDERFSVLDHLGTFKYRLLYEVYYDLLARRGNSPGVTAQKRGVPLVVSLTSIPERLNKLHLCVESLLRQSCKPDHLILWLDDSVPDPLPESVGRLTRRGLTIRRCRDIRSYKKIIFALRDYPNAVIATADDDFFYPRHWLRDLYQAYERDPRFIYCHRAHMVVVDGAGPRPYREWNFESPGLQGPSNLLFPTGAGGVLYPPGSLSKEVLNEAVFTEICPTADDIWLKAMALLAGTSCMKVAPGTGVFVQIQGTQTRALWRANTIENGNDRQFHAVFERYGLTPLLLEDAGVGSQVRAKTA
jgi:hypothetical protein